MSPRLYSEHGYVVENKIVYITNQRANQESTERLWFMCGYSDTTFMVVQRNNEMERILVESGMLLDLTSAPEVAHPASFFDHALHRLSSRSERVRLGNEIRSKLAKRTRYRWCGGELESVYNRDIVQNACEINGLALLGRAMDDEGVFQGEFPEIMTSNYSYDVFAHLSGIEEEGQKKLATVMHSIAIAYSTIVYIGSSPGDGWVSALSRYPNVESVVSIDPRPLSSHADARITHYLERILSPDRVYELTGSRDNCVLIWDVRGDEREPESRDLMIASEIATLNLILNHPDLERRFIAAHLKINTRHLCRYELPRGGRFFLQPYTLQRDVFEARYVVHLRSPKTQEFFSPSEGMRVALIAEMERVRDALLSGAVGETHLVANMMCARMRRINYIDIPPYNNPREEICLFSVTHNSPSESLRYLSNMRARNMSYIVSFFSGTALGEDPYEFPEGAVLARNLGIVLDSRSLIKAKMDGLYFVLSDFLLPLMNEEVYTSETYKIRRTEYTVANRSRTPAYDMSRMSACNERGLKFPKFPLSFSISERLVSPSGHALRMALEYMEGNASIALIGQKIVNNFRNYKRAYVRPDVGATVVDPGGSGFSSILRHRGNCKVSLERSPPTIWHSKLEWILGMEAAMRLRSPTQHQREQIRLVCEYLDRSITCPQPGSEISSFFNRAFGNINPLALARAAQRTDDPDRGTTDIGAEMLEYLQKRGSPDPIKWLTTNTSARSAHPVWREAIVRLKADQCARDYLIHTAIISTIDPSLTQHDLSKIEPLEFVLNVLSQQSPLESGHFHYLHYWRNPHHPEHHLIRSLRPDLERSLNMKGSLSEVIAELSLLRDDFEHAFANPDACSQSMMRDEDLHEFVVDLLARRWQKDLFSQRGFSPQELCNVSFQYLSKPTVPLAKVRAILEDFSKSDRIFLRFDAYQKLKQTYPDVFP